MTTTTTTRDMESAQNTSLDMFWDIGMFFFFFSSRLTILLLMNVNIIAYTTTGRQDDTTTRMHDCRLGLHEFFSSSLFLFLILIDVLSTVSFISFYFVFFIPKRSCGDLSLSCNTNVLQPNAKSATIRTCPNIVQPPHRLKTCPWTVEDTARKKWPRETQDDNHHIDTGN